MGYFLVLGFGYPVLFKDRVFYENIFKATKING
jgi:hypothetical protein